jgi:hypothetical protein
VFDNGRLKADPHQALEVINCLLAGMGLVDNRGDQNTGNEQALVEVHNSVWQRIVTVCLLSLT